MTTRAIPGRIARVRPRPAAPPYAPSPVVPLPAVPRALADTRRGRAAARPAPAVAAQTSSGVLTGFVTDGAGAPAPRTTVAATGDGGSVQETRTDDDGRFRLTLPPGPYRLEIATRSGASRRTATVVLLAGETVRIDIVVPPGDGAMGPVSDAPAGAGRRLRPRAAAARGAAARSGRRRQPPSWRWRPASPAAPPSAPPPTSGRRGASMASISAIRSTAAPGRRSSCPSATSAAVRAGVGADERDGSGAVLDIVTRAGGASLRGIVDVRRRRQRAGAVTRCPTRLLSANPRLADRDRPGRSLRAATVLERTAHAASRLRSRRRVRATRRAPARRPPSPGRRGRTAGIVWGSNGRTANVVGFVDRRSTTKDVPFAVRGDAAPGLENRRTSSTIASRGSWQSPLARRAGSSRRPSRCCAARARRGRRATCRRARTTSPARSPDRSASCEEGDRTRTVAGGALDWRTARHGRPRRSRRRRHRAHAGQRARRLLRRRVLPRRGRTARYRRRLAGHPIARRTSAARPCSSPTPGRRRGGWPSRRGVRAAHLSGGAYGTTSVQPRVGATLAVDEGARLVARASAGVVADPLYATHVDRTVGGETAVITYAILPDGRRVEIARTTPTLAGVAERHPPPARARAVGRRRLPAERRGAGRRHDLRPPLPRRHRHRLSGRAMAGAGAPGPGRPAPSRSIAG